MEQIPNSSEAISQAVGFTDTGAIVEAVEQAREQPPRGAVFDSERGDYVGVDQKNSLTLEEVAILLDDVFDSKDNSATRYLTVTRNGNNRVVTGHRSLGGGFGVAILQTLDTKTGHLTGLKVFTETDIAEQLGEKAA